MIDAESGMGNIHFPLGKAILKAGVIHPHLYGHILQFTIVVGVEPARTIDVDDSPLRLGSPRLGQGAEKFSNVSAWLGEEQVFRPVNILALPER